MSLLTVKVPAGPASLQRLLEDSVSGLFQLLVASGFAGLVAATLQSLSVFASPSSLHFSLPLFLIRTLVIGLGTTQIIHDALI